MSDLTKRLFIAINVPHEIQLEASEACSYFTHKGLFKGRCIPAENLHLTLKFLGDLELDQIPMIHEILSKISMHSFTITLGNLGAFTTNHIIKILYFDLISHWLPELARTIDYALEPIVPREERPFVSHVTLARIKSVADKNHFFKEVERYHMQKLQFKVTEFVLMESVLTSEGPLYKIVERYPLRAS